MMRQLRQAIGRDDQSLVFDRLSLLCADLALQLVALAWFGVLQLWREGFAACLIIVLSIFPTIGAVCAGMYRGPMAVILQCYSVAAYPTRTLFRKWKHLGNKKAIAQSAVAKIF